MGLLNSLILRLKLDGSNFQRGMKRAESRVEGFGRSVKRHVTGTLASAFGIAAVGALGRESLLAANRITNLADQINATTTEIQRLEFAFARGGLVMGDFRSSLNQMERNRLEAISGNEKFRKSFEDLGISIDVLNNASLTKFGLFKLIAEAAEKGGVTNPLVRKSIFNVLGVESGKAISAFPKALQAVPNELSENEVAFLSELVDRGTVAGKSLGNILGKGINLYGRFLKSISQNKFARSLFPITRLLDKAIPGEGDLNPPKPFTEEGQLVDEAEIARQQQAALSRVFSVRRDSGSFTSRGGFALSQGRVRNIETTKKILDTLKEIKSQVSDIKEAAEKPLQ